MKMQIGNPAYGKTFVQADLKLTPDQQRFLLFKTLCIPDNVAVLKQIVSVVEAEMMDKPEAIDLDEVKTFFELKAIVKRSIS